MKYFNEKMTTNEMRQRYFDLTVFHPVPEEEMEAVEKEHLEMIKITVAREAELAEAGYMC